MKVTLKKKYKTRDGRMVRLHRVDALGDYPIEGGAYWGGKRQRRRALGIPPLD